MKGEPDVVEEVLVTPRGPILTPVLPDIAAGAVALRRSGSTRCRSSGSSAHRGAQSFDEFRQRFAAVAGAAAERALRGHRTARSAGNSSAQLPRRRGGHGLLPRPADAPDQRLGRDGAVRRDAVRREPGVRVLRDGEQRSARRAGVDAPRNPLPRTARRRLHAPPLALAWLGADYCDDYRARAIRDELAARDAGWTLADCCRASARRAVDPVGGDARHRAGPRRRPTRTPATPWTCSREWDGRVDAESPAAAVFELFVAEMCVRVAKAKAPNAWRAALGEGGLGVVGAQPVHRPPRGAPVAAGARAAGGVVRVVARGDGSALREVVRNAAARGRAGAGVLGVGAPAATAARTPAVRQAPVARPGVQPAARSRAGGDQNTVVRPGAGPLTRPRSRTTWRTCGRVFDLADLSKSTFVLCGGQSGNPLSPHHADQLPLWQRGESFAIPWDQAEVIRAAVDTLRLLPAC